MEKRLKVVQINTNLGKGGAGKIVQALHEYYSANNVDSYVAYGRDHFECKDSHVYEIGNNAGVYFHAGVSKFLGLNGYSSALATKGLIKYLDEINPDIVHLHVIHGYYLNFTMLFEYLSDKKLPVLWTFHDCQAYTGKCGYHYECTKYQTMCEKCPYVKDYPNSLFFDFSKKMYLDKKEAFLSPGKMTIVSPSQWLTKDVGTSFFKDIRHVTINNGIDNINTFYPVNDENLRKKYGQPENKKIVLGVAYGFKNPRKGFEYLRKLAKDRPEYHFIMIGADSKMTEGMDNVSCISFIKDQNVLRDYYSMADLLVLPSLSENYATVGLESLSCGTPIACFDVGGNRELIKNDKYGIAVPVGDFEKLAEAADGLLGMHFTREEIHETMVRENSVKAMADKYLEEYSLLLQ